MGALLVALCFVGCVVVTGLVYGVMAIANRLNKQKDQKLSRAKGAEPAPLSSNPVPGDGE